MEKEYAVRIKSESMANLSSNRAKKIWANKHQMSFKVATK